MPPQIDLSGLPDQDEPRRQGIDLSGLPDVDLAGLPDQESSPSGPSHPLAQLGEGVMRAGKTFVGDAVNTAKGIGSLLLQGPAETGRQMGMGLAQDIAAGEGAQALAETATGIPVRQLQHEAEAGRYPELLGHAAFAASTMLAPRGVNALRAGRRVGAPKPASVPTAASTVESRLASESGKVNPAAAVTAGSGVAGAAYGGATGKDTQDAIERALTFGAAGALMGGSLAAGFKTGKRHGETDASGRDLGGYAGPERRGSVRTGGPAQSTDDAAYQSVREKLAKGEPIGSQANRELGQQKSQLEATRQQAAQERGETSTRARDQKPEPFVTNEQPPIVNTPEEIAVPPGKPRNLPVSKVETMAEIEGRPIPPARKPVPSERNDNWITKQPEHLREGLQEIADNNNSFAAQRREVQPIARTNAIAEYLTVERQKTLPRGTALNAEEIRAYATNVADISDRVDDLARKLEANPGDISMQAQLAGAQLEQITLVKNFLGARAESGRALRIQREFSQIVRSRDTRALQAALDTPGIKESLAEFSKAWAGAKTDLERMHVIKQFQTSTLREQVTGYYLSNILSGVKTQLRNVLGNTMNQAFKFASHGAASAADAARVGIKGGERTVMLGELKPQLVGTAIGIRQGIKDAIYTMKEGVSPRQLEHFQVPRSEAPGPLKYVGRTLEAGDALYYSIAKQQDLMGRIYVAARNEAKAQGLSGSKANEFIKTRMADLQLNPPKAMVDGADQFALHSTFKEDPGRVVEGILALRERVPEVTVALPFAKTPGALFRQGLEATPLAPVTSQFRGAVKAGGREQAQAIGRMITGSMGLGVGVPLLYWALDGTLTGSGPKDEAERAALMRTGWQPNSIKIGDRYVSFEQFQPLDVPMRMVANAVEAYQHGNDLTPFERMSEAAGKTVKSTLQQSYLNGLAQLINDMDRGNLARSTATTAQALIPFSGLQRNIAQAIDPTVRQPRGFVDSLKTGIPGASKTVEPRLTQYGEEATRQGGPLRRGLMVPAVSDVVDDRVTQELSRLKVNLGLPSADLTERKQPVKLSEDQSFELRKARGQRVREELERVMNNPGYDRLPDERKKAILESAISRGRLRATSQFKAGQRVRTGGGSR